MRRFDYDKLSFSFEQFPRDNAFESMADIIEARAMLFHKLITPDLPDGVRRGSEGVWTRRTTDGLGMRADLVQTAYDIAPEPLVVSRLDPASQPPGPAAGTPTLRFKPLSLSSLADARCPRPAGREQATMRRPWRRVGRRRSARQGYAVRLKVERGRDLGLEIAADRRAQG